MDAQEFFENAMRPEFPDEMNFQMSSSDRDPDRTFSIDGMENFVNQIHDFVMARVKGTWDRTGQAPKSIMANVKLHIGMPPLNDDTLELTGKPWTSWKDSGPEGLMMIDAELRADAIRRRN